MNGLESRIKGLEEHIEKLYKTIEGWEKLARDKDEIIKKYEQQVKNRELYKLKTKILRSKHISNQLREELANDVFEIEKLVNKTNEVNCKLFYMKRTKEVKKCHKCSKKLKKLKTELKVRTESSRPDDPYDGWLR